MKKRLIILGILICIFLFFSIVVLSNDVKYDFRKTNWGMSKEQVKATEKNKIAFEYEEAIAMDRVQVDGKECIYVYFFLEDKLYQSAYYLDETHTNNNDYINDFKNLKEALTKKYGKPDLDKIVWKNDLFKDNKQDWGTAISVGHLVYGAEWNTPTTQIIMMLHGDNYKITLIIGYYSKELKEWAKRVKERETSKDL